MIRILVTGGAGYVGSHLVSRLLSQGHFVTVIDNFMYGQPSLARHASKNNFSLVVGDVRDESLLRSEVPKSDIIIPLAAIVGAPACEALGSESFEINVASVIRLMKAVSSNQIVVFPSTNSVYGVGEPGRPCDENSPLHPISAYAKQKIEAEQVVLNHSNTICIRFATLFGVSERMRLDLLVNSFVRDAVLNGRIEVFEGAFKRNFLHVSDAAVALDFFSTHSHNEFGQIFNFGTSNENPSKIELASLISEFIPGLEIEENFSGTDPDQRNYLVDNSKISNLGLESSVSLSQGILELIKAIPMYTQGKYSNV
jgi:nucleoside-diphosphate-sugar epimerase